MEGHMARYFDADDIIVVEDYTNLTEDDIKVATMETLSDENEETEKTIRALRALIRDLEDKLYELEEYNEAVTTRLYALEEEEKKKGKEKERSKGGRGLQHEPDPPANV